MKKKQITLRFIFFDTYAGFTKLYKDKNKAKQEVERIFKILGSDNNKIDYTGFVNN